MTQYSSQTVANLRALLKSRGIPCTGLTRKQQIIDKLIEADNTVAAESTTTPNDNEDQTESQLDNGQTTTNDDVQASEISKIDTSVRVAKPVVEVYSARKPDDEVSKSSLPLQDKGMTDEEHKGMVSEEPDSMEPEPKEPESKKAAFEESLSKEPESEEADFKEPASEDVKSKETELQKLDPKEVEPKHLNSNDRGDMPKEPEVPDTSKSFQGTKVSDTTGQEVMDAILPSKDGRAEEIPESSQPLLSQDTPKADVETSTNSLPVQDIEEDAKKRKRRSVTPSISADDVAQKRQRQSSSDSIVHIQKEDVQMEDMIVKPATDPGDITNVSLPYLDGDTKKAPEELPAKTVIDNGESQYVLDKHNDMDTIASRNKEYRISREKEQSPTSGRKVDHEETIHPGSHQVAREPNGINQSLHPLSHQKCQDQVISPSLHNTTSSLYIKNLMRPLQPAALKEYLLNFANASTISSSSTPPDHESLMEEFFIDTIRTHCFVTFRDVSAAKRVRAAVHDRVWPDERTRKALWVDYVPDTKVQEWIQIEQGQHSGRPGASIRWEVVYEADNNGEGTTAFFQEIGSNSRDRNMTGFQIDKNSRDMQKSAGSNDLHASKNTGGDMQEPIENPKEAQMSDSKGTAQSFVALDSLFRSTTCKPKLYFLPVSKSLANERLDEIDKLTPSNFSYKQLDYSTDNYRYTFANGSHLVNDGPDSITRRPPRPRGRRGFGGRGRFPSRWGGRGLYR